ncbi:hypothetical protein HUO13_09125 [Saccharopolyspora erythraea]|uniref:hypothetical protein n=1 Tax=Saccharopolyspora erythraea TaxID=1836 RepID=UPI001BA7DC4E|nr:hypothetical protein [Saccharopolyspora erythraea]QUH00961.1 hypothetical protein HUO13_09125 [Saccharopolyspora erythraea]
MDTAIVLILIGIVVIVAAVWWSRQRAAARRQAELDDARAEARRWLERLSGQVVNLVGTNEAAKQALADASERHNAAGSQMEQAASTTQCKLVTETALEGLYYVRAARTAMDMDPGPELPDLSGQRGAGRVTEFREVEVDGRQQVASPEPTDRTPHYYPGGTVAGRPVPEGWYSEPWWKPAMLAGTWSLGSFVLMSAMFTGMAGVPAAAYAESPPDVGADGAADGGAFDGGGFDMGGFDMGGF